MFAALDKIILAEILLKQGTSLEMNPFNNYWIEREAQKLVKELGINVNAIIHRRLHSLRMRRKIKFDIDSLNKWEIVK